MLLFPRSDLTCWTGQSWLFYLFFFGRVTLQWDEGADLPHPAAVRSLALTARMAGNVLTRAEHAQHQCDLQSNPWTTAFAYEVAPNAHGKMCSACTQKFPDATVQCFSQLILLASSTDVVRSLCMTFSGCLCIRLPFFPQTISFVENRKYTVHPNTALNYSA